MRSFAARLRAARGGLWRAWLLRLRSHCRSAVCALTGFLHLVQRTPRLAPSNCRVVQEALRPVAQCPSIDVYIANACRQWRQLAPGKTLACPDATCSCLSILPLANGPKRSIGHVLGTEKGNFLIRDSDGPTMTAAPVESCQSLPNRSPWGRSGSVLYTCKRLHRTRRRFQHISANSLISAAHRTMNSLAWLQSSRRALEANHG